MHTTKPQILTTLILLIIPFIYSSVNAQVGRQNTHESYRIVFYNVENYFDPFVDSLSNYNEFVPDGMRHWTYSRYADKRNRIYKVLTGIGGWQYPAIVAFAEIENRFVLEDLLTSTPLKNANYEIVHFESKDERGIDVGLIYRGDIFQLYHAQIFPVKFESDTANKTRDILYVKGILEDDSLHLFINHWPSRYGGMMATNQLRITAAKTLIRVCDSVCATDPNAKILMMGDLNDDRENESLKILESGQVCKYKILPFTFTNNQVKGTLKYQGKWDIFDNIIVSESMLSGSSGIGLQSNTGHVYDPSFLLEADERFLGMKPYRTYLGYNYNDGFSDHLPIFVDIYSLESK